MCRSFPEWFEPIVDLALDLRWTWNHASDELWKELDSEAWRWTENPWWMLQTISRERIEQLAINNKKFKDDMQRIISTRQEYLTRPGWFQSRCAPGDMNTVAYFSMEFALGEALPLYAGGLGVLAGDYLKTASDMGVPIIGIGLLYQEGYLRQIINTEGWQIEAHPHNDPTNLPIRPVTDNSGGWLRIPIELPGRKVTLRVWQVQVGRVMLYLLDSNDPSNNAADRSIIYQLYDDRQEFRLMQEMALGIGGWRVIKTLGLPVDICHINEGHNAFLVLERARSFMQETGETFAAALWATRAGNIFTTHTPVAAGFDTFPPHLITQYFGDYAISLGITPEQLLALGRHNPENQQESFNMALLAMRGSININGVSAIHETVSRRIFVSEYPRWPESEIPVKHITNGVHVSSWDSEWSDALWTEVGGKGCWQGNLEHLTPAIQDRSDMDLWQLRNDSRRSLVNYVRQRYAHQVQQRGADAAAVAQAERALDPSILTIGFARRFTAYKRPNLLLHDPERLAGIVNHPEHPVQIIAAGKAHGQDTEGKRLVHEFVMFCSRPELRSRVVFIADYDMAIAGQMVQGVDLWINTPRRPWEACGTSGMKVLVNGGLNLSELDGWWAEAYSPDLGWAIGDGQEHSEPEWDAIEATQIYDLLESHITHDFYDRDAHGVPAAWIKRIRASMGKLAPMYSSNRMLREYVENMYLDMTFKYRKRIKDKGKLAVELLAWQQAIERYWLEIHFGSGHVLLKDSEWHFEVPVYFGGLNPDYVSVEIFADAMEGMGDVKQAMTRGEKLYGSANGFTYRTTQPAHRPAEHFSFRVIPSHPDVSVPLEENHILWYSQSH